MSEENVEVVRRVYEAINGGARPDAVSDELLATTFDPDVQLELPDLPGSAGTFRGYEGLRRADREFNEAVEDVRYEALEHAASGDQVAFTVLVTGTGRGSGAPAEHRIGHLFELKEGRIVRWVTYANHEEALEAVGLRE